MNDQLLENVSVKVEVNEGEFEFVDEIVLESLPCGAVGTAYVILQKEAEGFPSGSLSCTLKFTAKEVDQSTGEPDENGFEDDYQLEDLEITIADYMAQIWVSMAPETVWNEIGEENQVIEKYSLSSIKSLQQACTEVSDFLRMTPCGRTNYIPGKSSKTKHVLYLSGKFLNNIKVIARSRMKLNAAGSVDMELTVRSEDQAVIKHFLNR